MNKTEAIEWCKSNLHYWPKTTKFPQPEGWRWVMCRYPYQLPVFKLIDAAGIEIFCKDVYGNEIRIIK